MISLLYEIDEIDGSTSCVIYDDYESYKERKSDDNEKKKKKKIHYCFFFKCHINMQYGVISTDTIVLFFSNLDLVSFPKIAFI
jgi:hypothetical protein